jgi:outer membrane protein TolC
MLKLETGNSTNALRAKHHRKLAAIAFAACLGGCAADKPWTGFSSPGPQAVLPAAMAKIMPAATWADRPAHWPTDLPLVESNLKQIAATETAASSGDRKPQKLPPCRPASRTRTDAISLASSESQPPSPIEAPLPLPQTHAEIEKDSDSATIAEGMPLDISSALLMAAGRNPQVAFAQERIREAYARHQRAEVLWLPSLQVGATYDHHEGTIQEVAGPVFDVSRSAVYSGLGARAIGAGNPAFPGLSARFAFTDAIHQPEITAWQTDARSHSSDATRNQVLLDTALAYLDLLEAYQQRAIAQETLANANQLAELTESFASAGQGLRADADRAATELTVRQNAIHQADEAIQVASARLAQQLSLDPTVVIFPTETTLIPMALIACDQTAQELVSLGLQTRPELAENSALVQAAAKELERVRQGPLLPSVLLGMSYGGFGGGVGDTIANYRDRFDFEATAYWEVRNLGFGEHAARDEAQSQQQQSQIRQVRLMDQVAREIVEAQAQVEARRRQIETARQGIEKAQDSHRRNLERIEDGQGLPIEVLQSLQALDAARREYLRTVVSYNEAQFRLQWAIGWAVN